MRRTRAKKYDLQAELQRFKKIRSRYEEDAEGKSYTSAAQLRKAETILGHSLTGSLRLLYEQRELPLDDLLVCWFAGGKRTPRALKVFTFDPILEALDNRIPLPGRKKSWLPVGGTGGGENLVVDTHTGKVLVDDVHAEPRHIPVSDSLEEFLASSNSLLARSSFAGEIWDDGERARALFDENRRAGEAAARIQTARVGMTPEEARALRPGKVLKQTASPFPSTPDDQAMKRLLQEIRLLTATRWRDQPWQAHDASVKQVAEAPILRAVDADRHKHIKNSSLPLVIFYDQCDGIERFDRSLSLLAVNDLFDPKRQRQLWDEYTRRESSTKNRSKNLLVLGHSPYSLNLVVLEKTNSTVEPKVEYWEGGSSNAREFPSLWAFLVGWHDRLRRSLGSADEDDTA
jgi:hypothetical protein